MKTYKLKNNFTIALPKDRLDAAVVCLIECYFKAIYKDSVVKGLSNEAKKFCDDYYAIFSDVQKLNCANIPYDIISKVDELYSDFIKDAYREHIDVFNNFNEVLERDFIESLNQYCYDKYNLKIPQYLISLLEKVSLKLMDEQNRYLFYSRNINQTDSNVRDYKATLGRAVDEFQVQATAIKNEMNEFAKTTTTNLKEIEKKSSENSITILGIFSAIVLVANAGISLSTDVLQNLITADISKAVLIFSIFGVLLGNTVLGLIAYLEHVRTGDEAKSESFLQKIETPVFCLNIVLGFVVILLVISIFISSLNKPEKKTTTNDNSSSVVYQISGDVVCSKD